MNRLPQLRNLLSVPRNLVALFLALTLAPASFLLWFGWRQLEQDRVQEERRIHERREQATNLIATALGQALGSAEQRLADSSTWPAFSADDAWIIVLGAPLVQTYPSIRLPYYPYRATLPEAPSALFQAAETDETRLRDYTAAIGKLREIALSGDAAVRVGAQLRIARNLRLAGRAQEALGVYAELSRQSDIAVSDGLPADLVARRARCEVLARLDRTEDLQREALQLAADLRDGRWQLDRPTHDFYMDEIEPWLDRRHPSESVETERDVLAGLVDNLWTERRQGNAAGRDVFRFPTGLGTVIWRNLGDQFVLFAAGPRYIEREWIAGVKPLLESEGVRIALVDSGGHQLIGSASSSSFKTVRAPEDTGLPWTLEVENIDPATDLAQSTARGRLILAGLALLLIVVAAGSYFVARAFTRELAVARLQSDFVAAVSHEFRTPLTSLRLVTELLTDGRVQDADRLAGYYHKQLHATSRLQRLVESLLDFGRMEAGARPYRKQTLDAARWAQTVVADFRLDAEANGHHIEVNTSTEAQIDADPEALGHALRNLLDNAVKYSPEGRTVWVDLAHDANRLAIRVRDEGFGIPEHEQKQIFRKFVRGAASKVNGIKGTGVGLAMVDHIVKAHGGEVTVESAVGKGSTFTILLPSN
jgi:signal transduction histidine kinase